MVAVEAGVAVVMVGWFVAPNITELMNVARECATVRYDLFRGNKERLQKLAQDLQEIKRLVDQASATFVDQERLEVLWRLKDDIHDAEEVLDQFELERKATKGLINNMRSKDRGALSCQLVKVLKSLGETRQSARDLHQAPQISAIWTRSETGPIPVRDKPSFFGYHDKYNELYSLLEQQKQQPDGNKVIAILGHGGMGKTELARQAFRDAGDKFGLRIWVHAYGKNTELDLLQEIWRSVAGDRPVGDMNVACLQRELGKLLASKRCLLVLDDVWNHESAACQTDRKHAWDALRSFARFAEGGSRIVMTTRAKICATTFQADETIVLNGIEPNYITRLVNDTANLATDCTTGSCRIQELLNQQVPKFNGSPLAAVEIGDELKQETTSEKRCKILQDIEQHLGSVLSGHLFTYRHLPPHLQRCFELCSIFPDKWRFEPEQLTRMWIAHGFVKGTQHQQVLEDVARGYFDSLVARSLFHEVEPGVKGATYMIHEQIHWMIRQASTRNCFRISSTGRHSAAPGIIPTTVRHLSVTSGCLDQLNECPSRVLNNVRTLLILKNDDDDGGAGVTTIEKAILKKFKGVRVLDLTQTGLTQLPGTIGKLKHVRYLGLPSTMRTLCEQLTGLLFLQTFSVSSDGKRRENACQLQSFPENMNRLINMRHLDINTECIANISGIGKMVKLQGSVVFRASEKEGHGMSELAGMSSLGLGGTLSIKGLDAVASKEEAEKARLVCKGSVKVLKLEWGPPDPRQVNEGLTDAAAAVLEGLRPHRDLHDLRITRYPGAKSPSWLTVMEKLTCLHLRNCRRLRALPALGVLPCLERLDIKELTVVERIDAPGFCGSSGSAAFPKLKKIVLDDMPELVAWDDMPKGAFPLLSDVSTIDCPKLSSLSGLQWCSLHLRVKGCPAITLETLPATFSAGNSTCTFN